MDDSIKPFNLHFNTILSFVALEMTYIISDLGNLSTSNAADPPKVLFERVWPPKLQDLPIYIKPMAHTQVSAVSHETDCAFYCSHVTDCYGFSIHCSMAWKCNQYVCELYQLKWVFSDQKLNIPSTLFVWNSKILPTNKLFNIAFCLLIPLLSYMDSQLLK